MSAVEEESFLLFLCLTLIYGAVMGFCIFRLVRMRKLQVEWKQTHAFYYTVLAHLLLRTLFFLTIMTRIEDWDEETVFLFVSVPESLFILNYLLLIWQMLLVVHYTHQDPVVTVRPASSQCLLSRCLVAFAVVWICLQLTMYSLFVGNLVSDQVISRHIGLVNFLLPVACVFLMIVLHVKHSGTLPRTNVWKHNTRKLYCVTLCWSVTRIGRGVVNILEDFSSHSIGGSIDTAPEDLLSTAVWLSIILLSEIVCVCIILDFGFLGVFVSETEVNPTSNSVIEEHSKLDERPGNVIVEQSEVAILEFGSAVRNKLGVVHKAQYNDEVVAYRQIRFNRTSRYVIQECHEELELYRQLPTSHFVTLHAVTLDIPTIGIVMPYYSRSLYTLLHSETAELRQPQLLQLGLHIAKAVQEAHAFHRVHGHLTSHNILLTENLSPLVSDFGFHLLKKYAAIAFGYTNKSAWSSPELLMEQRLIPVKPQKADDVYSFGMLLWELLSGCEPFAGCSMQTIKEKVGEHGFRPTLPRNTPDKVAQLIVACWHPDRENRPGIDAVVQTLEEVLNT